MFWRCRCCSSPYVTHWQFSTDKPPKVLQTWDNATGFTPGTAGYDVGSLAIEPSDGSVYVGTTPYQFFHGKTVTAWEKTPKKRWRTTVATAVPSFPGAFFTTSAACASSIPAFVLCESLSIGGGLLCAFKESDGSLLWSNTEPAFSSSRGLNSVVYPFGGDFVMLADSGFSGGGINEQVTRYNSATGAVAWRAPINDPTGRPCAFCWANNGRIYAVYGDEIFVSNVYSVDGGTGALTLIGGQTSLGIKDLIFVPPGLGIFSDGSLAIAGAGAIPFSVSQTLRRANADATLSTRWSQPLGLNGAWALAIDASDNVYLLVTPNASSDLGSRQLWKYDKNGNLLYQFTIPGTPVDTPGIGFYGDPAVCVAVNPADQTVYVGGWRQKRTS